MPQISYLLRVSGAGDGTIKLDGYRGVTYQSDGKDLVDGVEYLNGGAKLVS